MKLCLIEVPLDSSVDIEKCLEFFQRDAILENTARICKVGLDGNPKRKIPT